jgi:hypothetical protein
VASHCVSSESVTDIASLHDVMKSWSGASEATNGTNSPAATQRPSHLGHSGAGTVVSAQLLLSRNGHFIHAVWFGRAGAGRIIQRAWAGYSAVFAE